MGNGSNLPHSAAATAATADDLVQTRASRKVKMRARWGKWEAKAMHILGTIRWMSSRVWMR